MLTHVRKVFNTCKYHPFVWLSLASFHRLPLCKLRSRQKNCRILSPFRIEYNRQQRTNRKRPALALVFIQGTTVSYLHKPITYSWEKPGASFTIWTLFYVFIKEQCSRKVNQNVTRRCCRQLNSRFSCLHPGKGDMKLNVEEIFQGF